MKFRPKWAPSCEPCSGPVLHSSVEIFRPVGVPMACGCVNPSCCALPAAWLHHSVQHAARVLPRWHFETLLTIRSNGGHCKEAPECVGLSYLVESELVCWGPGFLDGLLRLQFVVKLLGNTGPGFGFQDHALAGWEYGPHEKVMVWARGWKMVMLWLQLGACLWNAFRYQC